MIKSNFKALSPANFQSQAQRIVTAMTGNPHFQEPWPASVPSLSQIQANLGLFQDELIATSAGNRSRVVTRDAARDVVARDLNQLAHYAQIVAGDDDAVLATTGFPFRKPYTRTRVFERPQAPEKFQAVRGPVSGTITLNARPVPNAVYYELQIATTDPTLEASWADVGTFTHARGLRAPGLTPGKIYWFRLRAFGKAGRGDWSDSVSLMSI